MTPRENLLALLRREPYEWVPVEFSLCPDLVEEFHRRTGCTGSYEDYFEFPWRTTASISLPKYDSKFLGYHPGLKPGSQIDLWGVAHEPGSAAAKHMTYMRSPLRGIDSLSEVKRYPFPRFQDGDASHQNQQAAGIRSRGLAVMGAKMNAVWEPAWYIRGMEDLMMDMMSDDPIAEWILDAVTEQTVIQAVSLAKAGVDILFIGDDIGMQRTPMMSLDLYVKWLKPRLKQVISAAKAVNPELVVFYHSCGYVTPFIPHLMECGVDVLNPVQPESMDFQEIYREFGGKLSFHGTIGTQSVMPFGSPEEIAKTVRKHLDIAREKGGLFIAPTHLLEPEVPWENILAYIEACKAYRL